MNWRSACVFLVAVMEFRIAKIFYGVESAVKEKLKDHREFKNEIPKILYTLKNCKLMKDYDVTSYLAAGMGGVVFEVSRSGVKYVAKVVLDIDGKYEICNWERSVEKITNQKITYVGALYGYREYKGSYRLKAFYSCILILEKADINIDKTVLFPKNDVVSKVENSKKLLRFFGRVALSFAELHFKARILHGDIKPDNIMLKFKQIAPEDYDLIPVIIDFGLMLANPERKDINHSQLRYARLYRPPEMTEKTKIEGVSDVDSWYDQWENYQFSKEFTEDVYALGKTIQNVIEFQTDFINKSQCHITELTAISKQMTSAKERKDATTNFRAQRLRPNMKEVLDKFVKSIKSCSPSGLGALDSEFIERANTSLKVLIANKLMI